MENFTLNMRRRKIYVDTMQKLKIHFKDGVKNFQPKFVGDDETSGDGPLREFFALFFEDATNYILGSGSSSNFTFLHDIERIKSKEYEFIGNLIAMAIINGYAGPRYLMPSVAARLIQAESFPPPTIEDIPDFELQKKVKHLLNATDESKFNEAVNNFSERFTAGVTKPVIKFSEKHSFVSDICLHYCLSICSEEIDEVSKGLDLLGLRGILNSHPKSVQEFVRQPKQTAADLLHVFKNIEYNRANPYVPDGTLTVVSEG